MSDPTGPTPASAPPPTSLPVAPPGPPPAGAPAAPSRPPRPRPAIGLTGPSWVRPAFYYLACLLGIVIAAWGALGASLGIVHLIAPDLGQQNDPIARLATTAVDLIDAGVTAAADEFDDPDAEDALDATDEVLQSTRTELRNQAREAALNDLLKGVILLAIGGVIYRYHWLRVEPEAEPERHPTAPSTP